MEDASKRKVKLYTPNKIYSGFIDIKSENIRTIDLLNSSNLFWKDPGEKSFSDSILLQQATVTIEGNKVLGSFPKLQLRLADIIFFADELGSSGDSNEKARAATLTAKTQEKVTSLRVLTRMRGDAFYLINGIFYGLKGSTSSLRTANILAKANGKLMMSHRLKPALHPVYIRHIGTIHVVKTLLIKAPEM